ncbi:MAG TPA: hypothetical protein VGO58_04710 [Chitinophagaceae bacterium]|jgi:hypothetical protein|nr:hypothetical protein [Chitinophagaceae bacterium]
MSAHEIAKHAANSYKALNEKGKSWRQRSLSFFLELIVIVFAISVSLLLERWRENVHDRQVEKEFLIGFRQDLESDIKELKGDSASYFLQGTAASYFLKNKKYRNDSINVYFGTFFAFTRFLSNNSRFEALKSSGKLHVIHNEELLNSIMELYQEKIPNLLMETGTYLDTKLQRFVPYIEDNYGMNSDSIEIERILQTKKAFNLLRAASSTQFILAKYHSIIMHEKLLIDMVDKQVGRNIK